MKPITKADYEKAMHMLEWSYELLTEETINFQQQLMMFLDEYQKMLEGLPEGNSQARIASLKKALIEIEDLPPLNEFERRRISREALAKDKEYE